MLGESVRRRQPGGRSRAPTRKRFRWRPLLIALPFALLLPFLAGYLIATYMLFPPPQVTGAGISVPDVVGRSAGEAQQALVAVGLGPLDVSELPHPSAPAGQVVAQSPLPGQQLRAGAGVRVAISAGRPRVLVPDLQGFTADRAETMLVRSGFTVDRVVQESAVAAGRVIGTEPAAGSALMLPSSVMLIISSGPPAPPPDSLLHDTVPAMPPQDR
ncbi:hypothetical protein BH23GEM9_BH23GEM9_24540 [soil metagenome]